MSILTMENDEYNDLVKSVKEKVKKHKEQIGGEIISITENGKARSYLKRRTPSGNVEGLLGPAIKIQVKPVAHYSGGKVAIIKQGNAFGWK